jgi:hypothetical protein
VASGNSPQLEGKGSLRWAHAQIDRSQMPFAHRSIDPVFCSRELDRKGPAFFVEIPDMFMVESQVSLLTNVSQRVPIVRASGGCCFLVLEPSSDGWGVVCF